MRATSRAHRVRVDRGNTISAHRSTVAETVADQFDAIETLVAWSWSLTGRAAALGTGTDDTATDHAPASDRRAPVADGGLDEPTEHHGPERGRAGDDL